MTPKERAAMQQALECLEDIFGKGKVDVGAITALREALEQPVSQEPVGWYSNKGGFNECGEGKPLYAAPVRTKDLTDDEIDEIGKSYFDEWSFGFARAVIAADREKNK